MTIPASGSFSFSTINTEVGNASGAQLNMGNAKVRGLLNDYTDPISLSSAYGKSWPPPFSSYSTIYSGQSISIPSGRTVMLVKAWGAGGGGAAAGTSGDGAPGGSGAFMYASIPVSAYVGQSLTLTIGTGGSGAARFTGIDPHAAEGGGGGGWTGIFVGVTPLIVVGAGGGGGGGGSNSSDHGGPGGGGGITTGASAGASGLNLGSASVNAGGGGGGTPSAGGAGGTGGDPGATGTGYTGGAGGSNGATATAGGSPGGGRGGNNGSESGGGGGGGAGYYGGGGGGKNTAGTTGVGGGGGGGGSGYLIGTGTILASSLGNTGSYQQATDVSPPSTGDANYVAGVGIGGYGRITDTTAAGPGGPGLLAIAFY